DRVLAAVDEGLLVEGPEEIQGLAAPAPAQIQRELAQRGEGFWEAGGHRDRGDRLHGAKVPEDTPNSMHDLRERRLHGNRRHEALASPETMGARRGGR